MTYVQFKYDFGILLLPLSLSYASHRTSCIPIILCWRRNIVFESPPPAQSWTVDEQRNVSIKHLFGAYPSIYVPTYLDLHAMKAAMLPCHGLNRRYGVLGITFNPPALPSFQPYLGSPSPDKQAARLIPACMHKEHGCLPRNLFAPHKLTSFLFRMPQQHRVPVPSTVWSGQHLVRNLDYAIRGSLHLSVIWAARKRNQDPANEVLFPNTNTVFAEPGLYKFARTRTKLPVHGHGVPWVSRGNPRFFATLARLCLAGRLLLNSKICSCRYILIHHF